MADAVTVAADPRYTLELGCPARPLKLRVPVPVSYTHLHIILFSAGII